MLTFIKHNDVEVIMNNIGSINYINCDLEALALWSENVGLHVQMPNVKWFTFRHFKLL